MRMEQRLRKPSLKGELVVLRPIRPEDAPDLHAATLDPVSRRLTGTRVDFTLEQIETWCAGLADREDRVDLAIISRKNGEFLGEVVLNEIDWDNRRSNFRISLSDPRHFGKGYGSEAARLLLSYGFEELRLHRIELEVFDFNPRAIHVYEKLGFRREGVRREVLLDEGEYRNSIVMGLLEGEFSARPSS